MFFYEKIDSVIFIVPDNSCTFQLACYFPCTISTSLVGALVAVQRNRISLVINSRGMVLANPCYCHIPTNFSRLQY